MPAIPIAEMISTVQNIVDDENGNTHTPADILEYINGAIGFYDGILAEHAETALMQFRDVTHDGSELQDIMPYLPRIVAVERTSNSPRTETVPLPRGFDDRLPFISTGSGTGEGFYYIQNNQLAVVPQQASGTDRVWMVLRTPELHYGTATAGATTSSLVMAATPTLGNVVQVNDAYNFIPFMMTVTRELGVIEDFTGSSRTGTLQKTLENDPASAVYSMLPPIDPEFHWLYIWDAVVKCRVRTQENTVEPATERKRMESLLMQRIRKNQTQRNKYFTKHGW